MIRALLASGLSGFILLSAGGAMASPCGSNATTMLRRYGIFQPGRPESLYAGGASSAASTAPRTPGGVGSVPITLEQQRHVSDLVEQAISADHAGDQAGCQADLARARQIIR